MTCFLIDDDLDDRGIFQQALKILDSSIELVTAESGLEALKIINTDKNFLPDYIFLDLNMPYMSGRECLHKLREIERLKSVPIFLYSTVNMDHETLVPQLASGCVTKPKSIKDITRVLSEIIK